MYIIEYFNHAAAKGETVYAGDKLGAQKFLHYESCNLLVPGMQIRADEFMSYVKSIPVPQEDIIWNLESHDSGAYYVFSKCEGKRAKKVCDTDQALWLGVGHDPSGNQY